jgi:signal transduction histidine kinase
MAASLTFQPIDAMVRKITNRIFFKGRYNSEELLAGLTRIMAETMELETLTKKLLSGLLGSMGIEKGAFLIVNSHKIIEVKTIGYKGNDLANPRLEELFHHPRHHEGFIFDELEDQKVKDLFSNLDISVFIPVLVDKAEVAILVLGQKSCGQAYYDNDINFLNIFASEAGLAIQNSLRYEQIKKMNEELEARVAERTSQLEATQKKELEKAREVARLKDEFVFLAAHELRTPITAIRGFLALAESGRKFPKEVRDNMDAISQASAQLSQLITDLLEVARSDHGTLALKVDKISLGPLIKSTIRELAMQAKERKISVSIEVEPRITGVCDPEKFKEILLNLVSNAIKYNKERGEVTIRGFRDPRTGEAVIQVGDTGYGIPEEKQKFIFQKFFRAQTKETENVTGTGLGLFICRMLIEKMGGIINFSSTPGKGTTFTFTLPSGRGAGISGEMRLKTPGTFSAPDVRV